MLDLVKPHFFASNLLTQKRNLPNCSFKSNQRPAKSSIMNPRGHFDSAVSFTPRGVCLPGVIHTAESASPPHTAEFKQIQISG